MRGYDIRQLDDWLRLKRDSRSHDGQTRGAIVANASLNATSREIKFARSGARLQGIYVRGYEFEQEGEFSESDVEAIVCNCAHRMATDRASARARRRKQRGLCHAARREGRWSGDHLNRAKVPVRHQRRRRAELGRFSLLDREFGVTKCSCGQIRQRKPLTAADTLNRGAVSRVFMKVVLIRRSKSFGLFYCCD
jgi:DNA invertase Pin-like site-specific DNA recombinase